MESESKQRCIERFNDLNRIYLWYNYKGFVLQLNKTASHATLIGLGYNGL